VVVPPYPGHFSAWAMLVTKPRVDVLRTSVHMTHQVEPATISAIYAGLQAEAAARFADAPPDQLIWQRTADMRYYGQEHTVKIVLPADDQLDLGALEQAFHAAHKREYTFDLPGATIEFVTFHLTAWHNTRQPALKSMLGSDSTSEPVVVGRREVDFGLAGRHTAPVYVRDSLPAGFQAAGPLIVEEQASTTVVYPDQVLQVDAFANLIIRAQPADQTAA